MGCWVQERLPLWKAMGNSKESLAKYNGVGDGFRVLGVCKGYCWLKTFKGLEGGMDVDTSVGRGIGWLSLATLKTWLRL